MTWQQRHIADTAYRNGNGNISLGEDGQILHLVLEVPTGCPRENVHHMAGTVQEERTQSQKNKVVVTGMKTMVRSHNVKYYYWGEI